MTTPANVVTMTQYTTPNYILRLSNNPNSNLGGSPARAETSIPFHDEFMRDIERHLDRGDTSIPVIRNFEGIPNNVIIDTPFIENLNNDASAESLRVRIMNNLVQGRHDTDIVRELVRRGTPDFLNTLREFLREDINSNSIMPIINIATLGAIGVEDFRVVVNEIIEALLSQDYQVEGSINADRANELTRDLNEIDAAANKNIDELNDEQSRRRTRALAGLHWSTILTRGLALTGGAVALYTGMPLIRPMFQVFGQAMIEPRGSLVVYNRREHTEFNEVYRSFWEFLESFVRYMKG
jgi:hypothetical protein